MEEWARVAASLPVGRSFRLPSCPVCQRAKTLSVSKGDALIGFCFGCKTSFHEPLPAMTPQERHNPQIIDGSRRRRIARGSGTTTQDINQLLNQWRQAKKLIESMSGRRDLSRIFR